MSKIIVKDYVVAAYFSDSIFLAIGPNFIKDFPPLFLAKLIKKSVSSVCSVDKIPMIRALRGSKQSV